MYVPYTEHNIFISKKIILMTILKIIIVVIYKGNGVLIGLLLITIIIIVYSYINFTNQLITKK